MFGIGSTGKIDGYLGIPYLTEQQYLQGKEGYINPSMDTAALDLKKKQLLLQKKQQQDFLKKQNLISSIMAIPNDANKQFDITDMDKIRQSISSKTLGAQQLRIPISGA